MPDSTPSNFRKISCVERTKDFRKATRIVNASLPAEPAPGDVYVRIIYAGINASDINFTGGTYQTLTPPPYDCGFEGIGTIVQVGSDVAKLKVGDLVGVNKYGTFAEFEAVEHENCVPIPELKSEYLALICSGLTAAIALGEVGLPKKGEVALVTAAAGGTGQFAVQLLKHVYGCTVIGTCSSPEKVEYLNSIGCDHVINYKTEDMHLKLKEYAPKGLDVVYESVGGETFNMAVRHIAVHGRIVVIGTMSTYQTGEDAPWSHPRKVPFANYMLGHSASMRGFFLPHFCYAYDKYMAQLMDMAKKGTIHMGVDKTQFKGIESIADAVDYLYTGTSYGKVVVQIQ